MKLNFPNGRHEGAGKSGFTGLMWLVMFAVVGAAINATMTFEKGRELPSDYSQVDTAISENQTQVDELNAVAVLPALSESWRSVHATADLSGIEITPIDNSGTAEVGNTYTGPLKHWMGSFNGPTGEVTALARSLQKEVPMFLYDYTIVGGVMKLNFVVVGT